MKKPIFAILAALPFVAAAQTKTIEAVFHYPAGGGVDSSTAALWTAIEQTSDYRIKKVYYKSCAEAVDHVKKNPNSLLASESAALNLQGSTNRCPDAPAAGIKLESLVISASAYLCTAPGKPKLNIEDLRSNHVYKIAAIKHKGGSGAAEAFIKDLGSKSRVIPYANAVEFRAAATSGDVDYVFGINGIPELVAAGSQCLAASTKDNLRKLPTLRSFTKSGFPEFYFTTAIFTVHPNPELSAAIKRAMKTDSFQKDVAARQGVHLGLGSDRTVAQQEKLLINDYQSIDNF